MAEAGRYMVHMPHPGQCTSLCYDFPGLSSVAPTYMARPGPGGGGGDRSS